jgi:anion transporter
MSSFFLRTTHLSLTHIALINLLLAATALWSVDAYSYHAIAVALTLFTVLLGIASPEKAFSGFSSPSWFLVLGVFAISAAISKTGLLYRLVLQVLKRFPPNYLGQTFGLAVSGVLLTPVIPSANGRVALSSPLVLALTEIFGFKKGSDGSVGMAMASLLGFGHMSFMFMNGTATCFLALGLLPPGVSSSMTWGYWLKVTFPLGMVFFLGSYLAIIVLYRAREAAKINPVVIEAQLKTLGPMTVHEKVSLATVVTSLAGFMTQSWHHINVAWVAMLSFLVLLAGSVLDEKTVRSDIDWNFLISFGALVGFGSIISTSGLTEVIAREAKPYLDFFVGSTWIFLLMVTICSTLIRFILPFAPALLVCILAFLPISSTLGINPFVIGLVVLMCNDPWFLPHQDIMFQNLLMSTEGKLFTHGQTVKLDSFMS